MSDPDHPRPQLVRAAWSSLNGPWDYLADREWQWDDAAAVDWSKARPLIVPFAPETMASQIGENAHSRDHWYRRFVTVPDDLIPEGDDYRVLVHFGAVDHEAIVYVNGQQVVHHEGGYLPFTVDVTAGAAGGAEFEIVVHAIDEPHALDQPRGKQHWGPLHPWVLYPCTSGIWQPVWLEVVPRSAISDVVWTTSLDPLEVRFEVVLDRAVEHGTIEVRLTLNGAVVGSVSTDFIGGGTSGKISLAESGLTFEEVVWSPDRPTLLDADIELSAAGETIDSVVSYVGIRSIDVHDGRFFLNGVETFLRLALDPGYWTHTGLTPPNAAFLERDIRLAKSMGFNGVRKHQKLEDPRFLAAADRIGLLVWSELPACSTFSAAAMLRTTDLFAGAILRDRSHPCIITWAPFTEGWGVPDLENDARQRAFVRTLCNLARALDGTRPVVANDGWQAIGGNVHGIHDYETDPAELARRWAGPLPPATSTDRRWTGPMLPVVNRERRTVIEAPASGSPVVLSAFGGIGVSGRGAWGYRAVEDVTYLDQALTELFSAVRESPVLAGFCFTQLTDTYYEGIGLATIDRAPKIPLDRIHEIVTGHRPGQEPKAERPRLRLVRPA